MEENTKSTLYDFVAKHFEFIVQHTPNDCVPSKFWGDIYSKCAIDLNIELGKTKNRINWKKVSKRKAALGHTSASPTFSNQNNEHPISEIPSAASNEHAREQSSSGYQQASSSSSVAISSSIYSKSTTGTKRTRSSSAKSDSIELTDEMKSKFQKAFEAMDDKHKWDLGNKVYVEDILYKYGAESDYEHPSHSFILNVDDKCWEEVFTSEQLKKIKSVGVPALEGCHDACQEMFTSFTKVIKTIKERAKASSASTTTTTTTTTSSATIPTSSTTAASPYVPSSSSTFTPLTTDQEESVIDQLWMKVVEYGFINPRTHYDQYWIQLSMLSVLDLYRWKIVDWIKSDGSEMDYTIRLWGVIDKVFDNLFLAAKRDSSSVATTIVDNKDRVVSGKAPLPHRISSIRPDLVLFRDGCEYGAGECGKDNECGIGRKELIETGLDSHKVMKSMFLHLADKCDNQEHLLRSLRVVFFSQFHMHMHGSIMDSPGGYICRVRSTPKYEIESCPSKFSSGLLQILQLSLMTKAVVQKTIQLVEDHLAGDDDDETSKVNVKSNIQHKQNTLVLPALLATGSKKEKKVK